MWHPLSTKVSNLFANKRRSLGRYSSLADSDNGFFISFWFCVKVTEYEDKQGLRNAWMELRMMYHELVVVYIFKVIFKQNNYKYCHAFLYY
jgi:hypothetical protein